MPKILVLFAGHPTAMVHAVAEGARAVRFSEVELRRLGDAGAGPTHDHHQTLAGADEMALYDGVVVAVSGDGSVHPDMGRMFEQASTSAPRSAWQNRVGAAFMAETGTERSDVWPVLATLGNLGMLVVAPSGSGGDAAKELGARVAQAVGWVTHARSHHHHAH